MKKRMNKRDIYRAQAQAAMSETKRLVSRHGRKQVQYCLNKLRAWDKEAKRLEELKKQVAEMEKGLRA